MWCVCHRLACNTVGVKNVGFIKEPIAALLAYNVGQEDEKCHDANVLVYDCGQSKASLLS